MLIEKVSQTIKEYDLIDESDVVLVAVSGGIDSVTLLHILNQLEDRFDLKLNVIHLDHKIRGEASKNDAIFVKKLASENGYPVITESIDVEKYSKRNHLSLEEGARRVRYEFYKKALSETSGDKVALGHNLNDQVETFLMRLIRGTGIDGLKGMLPKRDKFIRPLIKTTREEIRDYARDKSIPYRQDRTNTSVKYLRNKIRWELIPLLEEEYNPNFIHTAARTEEIAREISNYFGSLVEDWLPEVLVKKEKKEIILDRSLFLSKALPIRRILIRETIKRIKGDLKDIHFQHVESILKQINKEHPRGKINLPGNLTFIRKQNKLIFTGKRPTPVRKTRYEYKLKVNETNYFSQIGWKFDLRTIKLSKLKPLESVFSDPLQLIIDLDKIELPLVVRNRRKGERIQPLGMQGTKKIKDLLMEEKIEYFKRYQLPLICDQTGIIWVTGVRMSEKYKIDEDTQRALYITASKITNA